MTRAASAWGRRQRRPARADTGQGQAGARLGISREMGTRAGHTQDPGWFINRKPQHNPRHAGVTSVVTAFHGLPLAGDTGGDVLGGHTVQE